MESLPPDVRNIIKTLVGLLSIVIVLIYFFYVRSLSDLLKTVRPENRKVSPGKTWLLLLGFLNYFTDILYLEIPLSYTGVISLKYLILGFMLFWQAYLSLKISNSITAEFKSCGIPIEEAPTWKWAFNYCLAMLVQLPVALHSTNSNYFLMAWLWVMVSWIIYWAETAKYKKRLRALPVMDKDTQLFQNLY